MRCDEEFVARRLQREIFKPLGKPELKKAVRLWLKNETQA
jgi:hypothetical protein